MKAQIKQWVNAGESVDNVKAALGMERLSGAALEAHSSYKYYQKFVEKTLKKWLKDDTSTYRAWINLGLLDGHSSDAFETYMRYAKMFNDEMWRTKGTLDQPPIYLEGSRAERLAKAQVSADAQRPNWYVKEMMRLNLVHPSQVRAEPDYPWYLKFLELAGRTER